MKPTIFKPQRGLKIKPQKEPRQFPSLSKVSNREGLLVKKLWASQSIRPTLQSSKVVSRSKGANLPNGREVATGNIIEMSVLQPCDLGANAYNSNRVEAFPKDGVHHNHS